MLELKAPPLEYSLNIQEEAQPYAEYSIQIDAEDFHEEEISQEPERGCLMCWQNSPSS